MCMTLERRFYFNLPEVQKALHANRTSLPYSWSMCSRQVTEATEICLYEKMLRVNGFVRSCEIASNAFQMIGGRHLLRINSKRTVRNS